MQFLKRLGYYLIGLSIGFVIYYFFVQKATDGKGLQYCYMPNCRTLKNIRTKTIVYPTNLESTKIDTVQINKLLKVGDVDFSKSDTKTDGCKTYLITNEDLSVNVKNCDEKAYVTIIE